MAQVSSPRSARQPFKLPELPAARLPAAARYAIGAAAVVVTLLVQLTLQPIIRQETPFLLFFAPILFTAWWAGLGPAVAATLLASLLVNYFLLPPYNSFVLTDPGLWLALTLFVVEGILFSVMVSALFTARQRAEQARLEALAGQERMAFLAAVSNTLVGSLDLSRTLPVVVERSVPVLADWCALVLRLDDDTTLRYEAGAPPTPQTAALEDQLLTIVATGQAGDPRPAQGALVVPVAVRDGLLGALAVARGDAYSSDDQALVEELSRRIANAAEAVQLFHASRRLNQELERRVQERTHELGEALDELRAVNVRLELSNRELEQFAYVASHDLQEPLRKIQAFGDRLKVKAAPQLSDDARDYLARMQSAASRMQTLINDLLAFSRVTSKAQPFVPVQLGQVAREVLADLETRIEQSGGQVEVGPLPTLMADPLQMRQLLQNLIGNALKFHRPEVPPLVRVTAETMTAVPPATQSALAPQPFCRLAVADNGIGFDQKYGDRIFNVFQRLHGRGQYEGSGVGLAICRKIVERHGGTIAASSIPGEGTTFVVMLPLQHDQPRRRDEPAEPAVAVFPGDLP